LRPIPDYGVKDGKGGQAVGAEAERKQVEEKEYATPAQERVIVRAARLRLSTDEKQGLESPEWVKEIARRPI
jgi:hypothetical protein